MNFLHILLSHQNHQQTLDLAVNDSLESISDNYGELCQQARDNPENWYSRMRAAGPVHPVVLAEGKPAWVVVRYAEALRVFTDPRFTNNVVPDAPARHMGMSDPPDHARLRAVAADAFRPKQTRAMRPRVQRIVTELLGELPTSVPVDLIANFATVLPLRVLCEVFGVPRSERAAVVDDLLKLSKAAADGDPRRGQLASAARERLAAVTAAKADNLGTDLLSDLIRARDEDDTISDAELEATILLIIGAGHEAPADLVGFLAAKVIGDTDLRQRLRREPELIAVAIEEALRMEPPSIHSTSRHALEDVNLGGVEIPAGALVLVNLGAANRDHARCPEANVWRLDRHDTSHIAFGHGRHFCLGAPLARMQAQLTIEVLLRDFPHIRPAEPTADLEWKSSTQLRGLRRFPVLLR